jgi:hypothetical protein
MESIFELVEPLLCDSATQVSPAVVEHIDEHSVGVSVGRVARRPQRRAVLTSVIWSRSSEWSRSPVNRYALRSSRADPLATNSSKEGSSSTGPEAFSTHALNSADRGTG